MRHPVSRCLAAAGWQDDGGGIKDASRRRCRSPSALLDPAAVILLGGLPVGTKKRPQRSNKETQFKRGSGGACPRETMSRRIVKGSVLPGAPEHAHPGSGEDTDGMRVVAAAAFGALVDVAGPGRAMPGVVGKAGDGGAQAVIAGPAPSARRVSCGPSSGKPDGPSRKTPGRKYITAYAVMYSQAKVHQ